MSARNSAFASISTVLRSGWGCDTTAVLAIRLSEKPSATARASGEPGVAVYFTLRAMNWTLPPTLRKVTILGPPKRCDRLLLIEPA